MASLEPGTVFASDFRIVRPLDAGGMGSIFVVEQLSTGNQRALKLMHPQLVADPKLRERFLQEARVGARIASDHVVQVIAAGVEPSQNVPWLAMELLAGEELDKRVKRDGPLPPREIAEIVKQLGHALSAAHAVGVVHRDLKPQNLFLCRPRVAGTAFVLKVLDFGIAKVVADAQTTGTSGMGTPLWMAPEQTEARSHVGPGTDIWALGLVVFYLLTGQVYWASAVAPSTSVHAVLREMLMEPIVPPSRRAQDRGRAALVPPGFDAWFMRAVERDPARRYASVDEAVRDLLAVLEAPRAPGPTIAAAPAPGAMGTDPRALGYASAPLGATPPTGPSPTTGPSGPAPYPTGPHPSAAGPAWPGQAVGASSPGLSATAVPAKRSGGGVIVAVMVGLLALAGVGGAVAYFTLGHEAPKKHARSSDDDDDDERPRKKKRSDDSDGEDKPHAKSKLEQCKEVIDTLNEAKKEMEATAKLENPTLDDIQHVADGFDEIAKTITSLELTDAELKRQVGDYADMTRSAASACRAMGDALGAGNRGAAIKHKGELDAAAAREPAIVASINSYCGATAPAE
jgi:hypothetical protein